MVEEEGEEDEDGETSEGGKEDTSNSYHEESWESLEDLNLSHEAHGDEGMERACNNNTRTLKSTSTTSQWTVTPRKVSGVEF